MATVDYEVRTPDKKILLFTVERDEYNNRLVTVKKGNKKESLSLEDLARIFFQLIK